MIQLFIFQTTAQAGGDRAIDSNGIWRSPDAPSVLAQFGNGGDDVVIAVARGPVYGSRDLTYDFGFVGILEIGDRVWFDVTRDGIQVRIQKK